MMESNTAEITYKNITGERSSVNVAGENIDREIISKLAELRSEGHTIVKTVMVILDVEYVYEYDESGHIEHVLRNGGTTP